MKTETKYFGEIEYEATDVLNFGRGIFAFEDEHEFLLLPFADSEGSLLCLQSLATPSLAFVLMNPFALDPTYAPVLQPEELKTLGVEDSRELCFYVMCVVKSPVAESTLNLKCPVAINDENRRAMQVILDTNAYGMRHLLSEFNSMDAKGEEEC